MKIKKISEFGLGIGEIGKRKSKIGKRPEGAKRLSPGRNPWDWQEEVVSPVGAKEKRDVALSGLTVVTRVSRASPFVKI